VLAVWSTKNAGRCERVLFGSVVIILSAISSNKESFCPMHLMCSLMSEESNKCDVMKMIVSQKKHAESGARSKQKNTAGWVDAIFCAGTRHGANSC
jgi:hypothetical protein